ncbi:fibronectin type 3 and ankyrin repeat domains protein 1 [Camelus ferus]|nr:fibronectin type 3 and ankyrin repeat domains protein 1 [Camelus ferus]
MSQQILGYAGPVVPLCPAAYRSDLDGVMTSREGSDSALSRQVQVGTLPGLVAEWTLCGWRQANGQKSLVTCLHPWGYATKHVVEGLEPRTPYRFRLKVTSPSGEFEYSPVVAVSTTREPISSEHFHRAVNVNDEDLLVRILQGGLVKILVSNGTDVNLRNGSGKDSLMLACYAGHLDVVKYLRRHGASWDTRDLGGCTALHWAVDGGHCGVIEWMIQDGCEVDVVDACSGWTPLMRVSAVSGNQKVASLLIDAGADVNVKDKDGKTPLMVAVLNDHEELVQLLLDKGADASVKNEV